MDPEPGTVPGWITIGCLTCSNTGCLVLLHALFDLKSKSHKAILSEYNLGSVVVNDSVSEFYLIAS